MTIKIYDVLGKEVIELTNNCYSAGYHETTFNATNLPAGRQALASEMYVLKAYSKENDSIFSKTMILMK